MKMRLSRIVAGLIFFSWVFLAFHNHKPHLSDLHPGHEACQICVHASQTFQKALPLNPSADILIQASRRTLGAPKEIPLSFHVFHSRNSRAPPPAE